MQWWFSVSRQLQDVERFQLRTSYTHNILWNHWPLIKYHNSTNETVYMFLNGWLMLRNYGYSCKAMMPRTNNTQHWKFHVKRRVTGLSPTQYASLHLLRSGSTMPCLGITVLKNHIILKEEEMTNNYYHSVHGPILHRQLLINCHGLWPLTRCAYNYFVWV